MPGQHAIHGKKTDFHLDADEQQTFKADWFELIYILMIELTKPAPFINNAISLSTLN